MRGCGIFYSRFGDKKLFGDFYKNVNSDEAIMQDDYEITLTENKIKLSCLDETTLNILREAVKKAELKSGGPIRGVFTINKEGLAIEYYEQAILKGKENIKTMINLFEEGSINRKQFIKKINFEDIRDIFSKEIIKGVDEPSINGESGSHGIAIGFLENDKNKVLKMYEKGIPVIYVTKKPGSEDIIIMKKSTGIIMTDGDPTAHPVILARSNNIPCIINLPEMVILNNKIIYGDQTINIGQEITINGTNGKIYARKMEIIEHNNPQLFKRLDAIIGLDSSIQVYANADNAEELRFAQELGAKGLGLCRTEHMMFETKEKLNNLRSVLFSKKKAKKSLEEFMNYQKEDFQKIFEQANGQRVVIRLLDPPINEFIPRNEEEIASFLSYSNMPREEYNLIESKLLESASHLGIRGIRFGIVEPTLYMTQVKAILESSDGNEVNILLPFISFKNEFIQMKKMINTYKDKYHPSARLKLGAMLETPISALESDFYAKNADFISYGLNDLTMALFALERVGSESLIKTYKEKEIIQNSPFESVMYEGMRQFFAHSVNIAKQANREILIGVCSEQVRDPETLKFFLTLPIDYVSSTGQSIPKIKYDLARNELNE